MKTVQSRYLWNRRDNGDWKCYQLSAIVCKFGRSWTIEHFTRKTEMFHATLLEAIRHCEESEYRPKY